MRFPPERVAPRDMATRLCTEQATVLGITDETLATCVDKVADYAQRAVDNWVEARSLRIPVVVNGTRFQVTLFPEIDDIGSTATQICDATEIGKTEEGRGACLDRVNRYLVQSVRSWADEKTLRTSVNIGDNSFEVEFMPEIQSPEQMAAKLCSSYMDQLGVTPEGLGACTSPVADYLVGRVNNWVNSKRLVTKVNINNVDNTLTFFPEREGPDSVARRVCLEKAEELQLTQENFNERCGTPLTELLVKEVEAWVNSKRVTVPMTLGDEDVSVTVVPERQSTVSVAQQVCVSRAEKLGLTNENVVQDCVEPVNNLLVAAVEKWAQQRTA